MNYPFDTINFFRLGDNLESIYEKRFALISETSATLADLKNASLKEIDWLYNRLIKKYRDIQEKNNPEKPVTWQKNFKT